MNSVIEFKSVPLDDDIATESNQIPEGVFPIPSGQIRVTDAAEVIFPVMGEKRLLYTRGGTAHEIVKSESADYLTPVTPERFCSLIEKAGKRVAKLEIKKEIDQPTRKIWRSSNFPIYSAKILLATDSARHDLPNIRQLVNCPILTPDLEVLTKGYHEFNGGTYISQGNGSEAIPFGTAVRALQSILVDFDFTTKADYSRAFASLISPALKMGNWIQDDFPLDFAEANESQSGKTYRQKLVCRLYNEEPTSITISKGGVGSIDESISTALVRGRPFITLGNIRGKIDSAILEEAIRGAGSVSCRPPFKQATTVDTKPFLWQLSTNGAELTRDLANRSIVTRIRKQPDSHIWQKYDECDLETHVTVNQPFYLSCIFSIIKEWKNRGCLKTAGLDHDFKSWCGVMDNIVKICGLSPLLDGHKAQQARTANPKLQWLRDVIFATPADLHGKELYTHELCDISEENELIYPDNPFSKEDHPIRVGRILKSILNTVDNDQIEIDGYTFLRIESVDYSEKGDRNISKRYIITKNP